MAASIQHTAGWTLAHCPPSSEWGPGRNTGEIKAARKGTGHPTSKRRWPRTSVLFNRHSPTYGSYMGLAFTFYADNTLKKLRWDTEKSLLRASKQPSGGVHIFCALCYWRTSTGLFCLNNKGELQHKSVMLWLLSSYLHSEPNTTSCLLKRAQTLSPTLIGCSHGNKVNCICWLYNHPVIPPFAKRLDLKGAVGRRRI